MKRIIDLTGAAVGLVALAPVMAAVATAVRIGLGSPVLFRQTRPGLHGGPFEILKFRTMTDERDEHGALLPNEERQTRLGSLLRRTSLDELPELFNVLRGEMSLVGPRPLLMEYVPLFTPEQRRRLEVKPGITGWAQIQGRNALEWERRFELDVWYVDHRSTWLDLRILARTAWLVIRRKDISPPGRFTTERFRGSVGTAVGAGTVGSAAAPGAER